MMEYKGYVATVEYDHSVELFHGEVVNAGACLLFPFPNPRRLFPFPPAPRGEG